MNPDGPDLDVLPERRAESHRIERLYDRITELEARLEAVLTLHSPFGIYDECGHDHTEDEPGVVEVDGIGLVCAEGKLYEVCRTCHYDMNGEPLEDVDSLSYPCATRRAAEGKP